MSDRASTLLKGKKNARKKYAKAKVVDIEIAFLGSLESRPPIIGNPIEIAKNQKTKGERFGKRINTSIPVKAKAKVMRTRVPSFRVSVTFFLSSLLLHSK